MGNIQNLDYSPFFSVIIPVFNRALLLKKLLDSLELQTLPFSFFEVLVVDDGSSENLEGVINSFKKNADFKLSYIHQTNGGPAKARNTGIKYAKAEFVMFIDSDCVAAKDWLETAYLELKKRNFKIDLMEGKTLIPDKEKRTPFTHQTENLTGGRYPTCNLLVRKVYAQFDENYGPQYYFREDSDLAFSLMREKKIFFFNNKMKVYHPVISGHFKTPFYLACRYRHDERLRSKFPKEYKTLLDGHLLFSKYISHLRKKIYAVSLSLEFLGLFVFFAGMITIKMVIIIFILGQIPTYYLLVKGTPLKINNFLSFIMVIPISFIIPWYVFFNLYLGKWKRLLS